jgi:hypothetical protein
LNGPAQQGEGSGFSTTPDVGVPTVPAQPGPTSANGSGPAPAAGVNAAPISERALSRTRRVTGLLSLVGGLLFAAGATADMLSIFDFISSGEHPALGWVICCGLVLAPVVAAAVYFLLEEWPLFLYCVAGVFFVALGAYHGGALVERARSPVESGKKCETKPYDGEPAKLQDCRRIVLEEGHAADLDDKSTRATKAKTGLDVVLRSLTLAPADDSVSMAVLDSTTIKNGKYPISYPGCEMPERTSPKVDLKDLSDKEAVCIGTDDGRVAIVWVVDIDDERQSAVFNVTCWKKKR